MPRSASAVITPRWLYVLAAATPTEYGDPLITDETLEQIQPDLIQPGDVVGIGIHTGNALRGYAGRTHGARARRLRGLRRHPRDAVSGRSLRTGRRARRGQGRRRRGVGQGDRRSAREAPPSGSTRAAASPAHEFLPARWDLAAARPLHVGVGADRARLPEALFVLLGVAYRRAEAAAARSRRSDRGDRANCGGWGFASSRWPTTISIR